MPVTAPKSFFGNLGPGTGAVEMAASVLALQEGLVPQTLNFEHPDPDCPVNVIHSEPMPSDRPIALVRLRQISLGDEVELELACPNPACGQTKYTTVDLENLEITAYGEEREFALPRKPTTPQPGRWASFVKSMSLGRSRRSIHSEWSRFPAISASRCPRGCRL